MSEGSLRSLYVYIYNIIIARKLTFAPIIVKDTASINTDEKISLKRNLSSSCQAGRIMWTLVHLLFILASHLSKRQWIFEWNLYRLDVKFQIYRFLRGTRLTHFSGFRSAESVRIQRRWTRCSYPVTLYLVPFSRQHTFRTTRVGVFRNILHTLLSKGTFNFSRHFYINRRSKLISFLSSH